METIAVIFGGRTAEHDISVVTAIASIIKPLELTHKYQVLPVYITKEGAWYSDNKLKDIKNFTKLDIETVLAKLSPIKIELDGGLKLVKKAGLTGRFKTTKIDIVFPAMHGTYGEDGSLMGLLDLAGVPYIGCGVAGSAIAMDKKLAKELATANSIPTSKYVSFSSHEISEDIQSVTKKISSELKLPVFVKPAHLGSSIGISRATNPKELNNALEVAAHYDNSVVIEEEVGNLIEVTLPIIGNNEPTPAYLESPITQKEEFFDFDTKYIRGGGKKGKSGGSKGAQGYSIIPAKLDKDLYSKAEELGLKVYKDFGLYGIARVDMLIDSKTNTVYFNEINPLPGGLYSHNWNKAGISNVELVEKLIAYAKEKFEEKNKITTTFSTSFLKQF